jgi:hypothetical protein
MGDQEQKLLEDIERRRQLLGETFEEALTALVLDARDTASDYYWALKQLGVGTEPVPDWIEPRDEWQVVQTLISGLPG